MNKCLFLILLLTFTIPATGQRAGRIFMDNESVINIDSFYEVSVELVYNWSFSPRPKNNPGSYFKTLQPAQLEEISFIKQEGRFVHNFSYVLRIKGITKSGRRFKKRIYTWDWLEMKQPGMKGPNTGKIVFFHDKRRMDIERIVFY